MAQTDGGTSTEDGGTRDAGSPIGGACETVGDCMFSVATNCRRETMDGGSTGWAGGYCTATCLVLIGFSCPDYAYCNNPGSLSLGTCEALCTNSGSGQSTCRPGYVCERLRSVDAGDNRGICVRNCHNAAGICGTTQTCNSLGYCN